MSALNGTRPVSISKAMQARAYWSALASSAFPIACSGAMYDGVPMTVPVAVRPETESALRARPKSARSGRPAESRRTFPGLTSRWRIPFAWAWSSAAAIAASQGTASAGGTGPRDPLLQRAPGDEGHDEVRDLLPLEGRRPEVVDGEDVRVLEPGHEAGLAEEALGEGRVGRDRVVDDLDGDRAVEGLVLGPPDFRHPAGAGALEEAISTQEGSGGYGHGVLVSLP